MTWTNQWETRHMTRTTNQNMTQWTREPIAWRHEGNGSIKQTGTETKLQNKRHENKNMKQNPKQTLHLLAHCKESFKIRAIHIHKLLECHSNHYYFQPSTTNFTAFSNSQQVFLKVAMSVV